MIKGLNIKDKITDIKEKIIEFFTYPESDD